MKVPFSSRDNFICRVTLALALVFCYLIILGFVFGDSALATLSIRAFERLNPMVDDALLVPHLVPHGNWENVLNFGFIGMHYTGYFGAVFSMVYFGRKKNLNSEAKTMRLFLAASLMLVSITLPEVLDWILALNRDFAVCVNNF